MKWHAHVNAPMFCDQLYENIVCWVLGWGHTTFSPAVRESIIMMHYRHVRYCTHLFLNMRYYCLCVSFVGKESGLLLLLWVSVVEGEMFCCVCALVGVRRGLFLF